MRLEFASPVGSLGFADMGTERAIWCPYWYELDQPIAVGEIRDLDFFKTPPDYVKNDGLRVFYHGDWQEKCRSLYVTEKWRITNIEHPVLGRIRQIETDNLDYRFTMSDGQVLLVEAEESPGVVHGWPESMGDWRIFVEMEPE